MFALESLAGSRIVGRAETVTIAIESAIHERIGAGDAARTVPCPVVLSGDGCVAV